MNQETSTLLDSVKFDDKGLVPCVCQDADTGEVLMVAYMNRESLGKTAAEQRAVYFSRSRGKLWIKGESSGNTQQIVDLRLDCDGDCVLIKVRQSGPACHTGFRSCFYREWTGDAWRENGVRLSSQEEMDRKYGK